MTEVQLITTPTMCPLTLPLSNLSLKVPAESAGRVWRKERVDRRVKDQIPFPLGPLSTGCAVEGLNFAGLDPFMPENETVLQVE